MRDRGAPSSAEYSRHGVHSGYGGIHLGRERCPVLRSGAPNIAEAILAGKHLLGT